MKVLFVLFHLWKELYLSVIERNSICELQTYQTFRLFLYCSWNKIESRTHALTITHVPVFQNLNIFFILLIHKKKLQKTLSRYDSLTDIDDNFSFLCVFKIYETSPDELWMCCVYYPHFCILNCHYDPKKQIHAKADSVPLIFINYSNFFYQIFANRYRNLLSARWYIL